MNSIPHSPGIYKIICIANNKIYVGSAVDLFNRWSEHKRELRGNYHHNAPLQNAYNKYGETAFVFEIIELVMPWSLLDREQYWLDQLKPYKREIGFNVALDASAPTRGLKASPETRKKLSNMRKGRKYSSERVAKSANSRRGAKRTPEQCARIREGMENGYKPDRKNPSLESREKTAEPQRKNYIVIDPNGIEMQIKGIAKFCRENNLQHGKMVLVAQGKRKSHKGWKCRYV